MASSAFVLTISPNADEIDPKIALETGYAILMEKPIVALVAPGINPPSGLIRAADHVIRLEKDYTTPEGQAELNIKLQAVINDF